MDPALLMFLMREPVDLILIEAKSDNLMNVVIESRRDFALVVVEYNKKMEQMEKKLRKLQSATGDYSFKTALTISSVEEGDMNHLQVLAEEICTNRRRFQEMQTKMEDTKEAIMKLEALVQCKHARVVLTDIKVKNFMKSKKL